MSPNEESLVLDRSCRHVFFSKHEVCTILGVSPLFYTVVF